MNESYIAQPDDSSSPPPAKIVFTVGIFFDGTANNAHNTTSRLQACDLEEVTLDNGDTVPALDRHVVGLDKGSYLGYYSNIHWLSTLYQTDFPAEAGQMQQRIYIEGIGTQAGEKDRLLDAALGIGERGVVACTDNAIAAVATLLRDFFSSRTDPASVTLSEVQFDLFGFSRGAAAARHFANRVFCKDPAVTTALQQGLHGVDYRGAAAGKVRFLGLFDTVAAIGTLANGLNPNSAHSADVQLELRPGVAEKVFHLTAQHECRFNFALNGVKPAWPELALPGVHSDIGGGYHPEEEEHCFLTRPQFVTVPLDMDDKQTRIYQQAAAGLAALRRYPSSAFLVANNQAELVSWHDDRMPTDHHGTMQKRSAAAVVLRRRVRNDWAKVALRVMLDAATEAGVMFLPVDTSAELVLPANLESLCEKAVSLGRAVRMGREALGFTTPELNLLAGEYLHCSANWNAVSTDGNGEVTRAIKPGTQVSFTNRPDINWQRTVYTVDGRKA